MQNEIVRSIYSESVKKAVVKSRSLKVLKKCEFKVMLGNKYSLYEPNMHTNFQRNMWNSYRLYNIFCRQKVKESAKWKCCHGNNNFCQNFQKVTVKWCWTFIKVLWKYDMNFHVRNKHRQICIEAWKEKWLPRQQFLPLFMTLHIIKFCIGINMLYKFGKDRWKIVPVRGLSFRMDGRTETVSISPFNVVDGG